MFRNMYSLNLHFYFNLNNISVLKLLWYLNIINEKAFLKSSFCIIDFIKINSIRRVEIKIFSEFLILIPKLKFQDKNNLKLLLNINDILESASHIFTNRGTTNMFRRGGIKMANSSKWHTRWKPRRYHHIYYSKCVFSFHRLCVLYTTRSFIPVSFFKKETWD